MFNHHILLCPTVSSFESSKYLHILSAYLHVFFGCDVVKIVKFLTLFYVFILFSFVTFHVLCSVA